MKILRKNKQKQKKQKLKILNMIKKINDKKINERLIVNINNLKKMIIFVLKPMYKKKGKKIYLIQ